MMFKRYGSVLAVGLSSLFGLGGCVGYDGSADGASSHAQGLGVTSAEESSILGALAQKPMTTEELDKIGASLDKAGLPSEWAVKNLQSSGAKNGTTANGDPCIGDINCQSRHCSNTNRCIAADVLKGHKNVYPDYPNLGENCTHNGECASHRCEAKDGEMLCVAPGRLDLNGIVDQGETDVDCGGENSPFDCALGMKCSFAEDCVVGVCAAPRSTASTTIRVPAGRRIVTPVVTTVIALPSKTCTLSDGTNGALVDVAREWPDANRTGGTYAPVKLSATRTAADQILFNNGAAQLRAPDGALVDARATRWFQRDVCVGHLVAEGCSTIAVATRNHRVSYNYVICPRDKRPTIGITTFSEYTLEQNWAPYCDQHHFHTQLGGSRGTDSNDPYLCNRTFTRAMRVISKTPKRNPAIPNECGEATAPVRAIDQDSSDSQWSGSLLFRSSGNGISNGAVPIPDSATYELLEEIQKYLLINAACSRGRVTRGTSVEAARALPPNFTAAQATTFCENNKRWGGGTAPAGGVWTVNTAAELAFVKLNAPYYKNYDVYSIDPEGNPNRPANRNLQYGWDAMHPSYSFGAYAAGWGVAALTAGTYKGVSAYGTTSGTTFTPFNMGW